LRKKYKEQKNIKQKHKEKKMKKMFIVLLAIALFAAPSFAFDSKDAGFTKEGVFYVSNALIEKAGFGAPTLQSSVTGWGTDLEMKLSGDYWTISTGKKAFGVVAYCFQLGYSNMWLPHVMVDQGVYEPVERYNNGPKNQVIPNGNFGYNYVGKYVPKLPF